MPDQRRVTLWHPLPECHHTCSGSFPFLLSPPTCALPVQQPRRRWANLYRPLFRLASDLAVQKCANTRDKSARPLTNSLTAYPIHQTDRTGSRATLRHGDVFAHLECSTPTTNTVPGFLNRIGSSFQTANTSLTSNPRYSESALLMHRGGGKSNISGSH